VDGLTRGLQSGAAVVIVFSNKYWEERNEFKETRAGVGCDFCNDGFSVVSSSSLKALSEDLSYLEKRAAEKESRLVMVGYENNVH
jgi:hypothetical protein